MSGQQEVESFADMTPIGLDDVQQTSSEGNPQMDSFDDMTPILEEPSEDEGQDKAKDESEVKTDETSQVDQLDEEEAQEKSEKEDEEKEPKDKSEDDGKSEEDEPESNDGLEKDDIPEGKALIAKLGEDKFNVNENMTLLAKVAGKNEPVTVRDLLDNYSGKVQYDKKFSEFDNKNKALEVEKNKFKEEFDGVTTHLNKIRDIMDNEDADPMEALYYLVDITGRDRYDFYKRSIDSRFEEFERLSDMSDTERQLHFTNTKLELIQKRDESSKKLLDNQEAEKDLIENARKVREAHGVSDDQFDEAFYDLKGIGYKEEEITIQQVIDWAKFKPNEAKAQELLTPYKNSLDESAYDEYIVLIAKTMMESPDITSEEVSAIIKEELGVESSIKELERKVVKKDKLKSSDEDLRYGKRKSEDEYESFDDFDY